MGLHRGLHELGGVASEGCREELALDQLPLAPAAGSVRATPRPAAPFLFDTESMPLEEDVCSHCPGIFARTILCCGMCQFENRQCNKFYPGALEAPPPPPPAPPA